MTGERKNSDKIKNGETADKLSGGRLIVLQKERGYRFSVDAILLAHFMRLKQKGFAVELGAGSGVISMILSCRFKHVKLAGVEIQPELFDMAKRSVELNELEDRIELHLGDIRKIGSIFKPHSCDAVFFNPPYRKLNSGRVNPHHEKAVARHEVEGALNDFIRAGKYLLKSSGAMYAIYPATRGVNLIVQMKKSGIEPKRLRMVHSDKISEAEFIIVEGIKGGREELKVMPPLFIYEDTNEYSCEMKKILKEITDPHLSFC